MAEVARISVAPVKGLALAHPDEIELEPTGVRHNRRFYLVGEEGRLVNGKALGSLVRIEAQTDIDATTLVLRLPDGDAVEGDVALGTAVETNFYGRPVAGHLVLGPWSRALSEFMGTTVRLVRADEPGDGSDRGARAAASLVSVASLERLADEARVESVDGRRFRMLFTITSVSAHEEDSWVGRDVGVGDAVVRMHGLVGRCAVTTHDPDTGIPTLDTLHILRGYRGDVPTDEPLPFGVWGEVVAPGPVRTGDAVELF
jgi:uncharacterized protein YcbX